MLDGFQSRWHCRQIWLTTSHYHIKITIKIQNSCHSDLLEIELNGSLTTIELRKHLHPHWQGGCRCRTGWSHTHVWRIKTQEGYLKSKESQPYTRPLAQGSSARKVSPHNFWLQKLAGIESVEETSGPPNSSS